MSQQNFSRRVTDFLAALPFVQRSRALFQTKKDARTPRLDRAETRYGIVAQTTPAPKPPQRAGFRLTWVAVPAIVVGGLVAGWWLWSRMDTGPALAAARTEDAQADAPRILAPTFTPTAAAAQDLAAAGGLMQIVIVTPTPDPSKRLVVAGTVIDRPLAVSGSEGGAAADARLGGNLIQAMTFNVAALNPALIAE